MRGDSFDGPAMFAIERALRGRTRPEPTAALRERVMDGVNRALSEPAAPGGRAWPWSAGLVGWAAVLLVGLALSRIAASATLFFGPLPRAPSAPAVRATAELLRQVAPGLAEDDANRIALASAYRGNLVPVPALEAGSATRWADPSPSPRPAGAGWGGGRSDRGLTEPPP
jgi:hypothetical protein